MARSRRLEPNLFADAHPYNGMVLDAPYDGTNVVLRYAISIAEGWAVTQVDIMAGRGSWPALKSRLDSLMATHKAIFQERCGPLEWDGDPALKRVWIKAAWRNLNLVDPSIWPELQEQMVRSMKRLADVVVPYALAL